MLRRLPHLAAIAVLVLALAALAAGCDSGDDDTTTTGADTEKPAKEEEEATGPPVGPPPTKESIAEAEKRIQKAVDQEDCAEILALYGIPDTDSEAAQSRCDQLIALSAKRLGNPDLEDYGDLAGVIDWDIGDRVVTLVLVRQADGTYRLVITNANNVSPTSEGELDEQAANETIDAAMKALRDRDCKAFTKVVSPLGAKDEEATCTFVDRSPLGDAKQDPKLLGGNDRFAFYSLETPAGHYTFVLATEEQGRGDYGYVAGYQTATPDSGTSGGGDDKQAEGEGSGSEESAGDGGQTDQPSGSEGSE